MHYTFLCTLQYPVKVWATQQDLLITSIYEWLLDDFWSHKMHVGWLVLVNIVLWRCHISNHFQKKITDLKLLLLLWLKCDSNFLYDVSHFCPVGSTVDLMVCMSAAHIIITFPCVVPVTSVFVFSNAFCKHLMFSTWR